MSHFFSPIFIIVVLHLFNFPYTVKNTLNRINMEFPFWRCAVRTCLTERFPFHYKQSVSLFSLLFLNVQYWTENECNMHFRLAYSY